MRFVTLIRHPVAMAGAVITTVSAVVFIGLAIAAVMGMFSNPYAGLVVFVVVPGVFLVGLLLIPIGGSLERRWLRRHPDEVVDWPVVDLRKPSVRRTIFLIIGLTAVNVVIVSLAGYGGVHWMESPQFCGQACHAPMHPQFTAWQASTHSRIACVNCHVGEGARGFLRAKLAGVRQLAHVVTAKYPRPVPVWVDMPPGAQAQTCVGCHQPHRTTGDVIRLVREYADDEANSETITILQMHVGTASSSGRSIHWHADPSVRVDFAATDETRQTIPYVRVTRADGSVKEYRAEGVPAQPPAESVRMTMDCTDCHNTVGHPIAPTPEKAVDGAIADGLLNRKLPFARREAVRLMTASHANEDEAVRAIERELRSFYESRSGGVDPQTVAQAIAATQKVYRDNIFPWMKVTWGTYPNNKGHVTSNGCFRCHDDSHQASDGSKISADCEYCHKQIERELN
jgi:hypothetical protein